MDVHQSESDREIAIARRVNKRDEMLVPADLDRSGDRCSGNRQQGQPLGDTGRSRPVPGCG
jgi:hypothetical protein